MKRVLYPAFISAFALMMLACSESDEPRITGSSDDPNVITAIGSSDSQGSSSSEWLGYSSSEWLGYSSSEPISIILCRGGCAGWYSPYSDLWEVYGNTEIVNTDTLASEPWNNVDKGKWAVWTDSVDGGKSRVIWPVELGDEWDANSFQPVIDYCAGLCGHIILDGEELSYDPFVEVGFYVAGFDSSGTALPADISNWEGICISYISTLAPVLALDLGDSISRDLEYDEPIVKLPKSADGTDKCFQWSDFAQAGWGKGKKISGEEAAKTVVSIRFMVQSKSGTEGDFHIFGLGTYTNHKE